MRLSVSEAADLAGVSVRTLHYYHEAGVLPPSEVTPAGYRYYDEKAMERLQEILFYRELDFSLFEIRMILSSPLYDRQKALEKQRRLLFLKKKRLERLIGLLDNTMNGGNAMQFEEFDRSEIEAAREEYAEEVKNRWGGEPAYAESQLRTQVHTKEAWEKIQEEMEEIFLSFAGKRGCPPESGEVQALVRDWQAHISGHYYDCTPEILLQLGEMYVEDKRFTVNLDKYGEGTALFMCDAIRIYCQK